MPEEDKITTLVAGLSFCPLSPAENQFPVASGCAGSPASSRVSVGYCSGVARCARFTQWTVEQSVIQIVVIRCSCLLKHKHVSDFRSVLWFCLFVCPVDLARLSFTKFRVNAEDPLCHTVEVFFRQSRLILFTSTAYFVFVTYIQYFI